MKDGEVKVKRTELLKNSAKVISGTDDEDLFITNIHFMPDWLTTN